MLNASQAYQAAAVADARRVLLRVVVDISDPDLAFGAITYSDVAPVCVPAQVEDKEFILVPFGTLETDRWILDGTMQIFPDSPAQLTQQAGFIGNTLSGADGTFPAPVWVQISFENVAILQACSVYFPTADYDGVPDTFTVEMYQGGTAYYTQSFTGNTESEIHLDGFTVVDPDAIRVTVTKWSLPDRRLRVVEIVPGIYERWDSGELSAFDLTQQVSFSCLALPYGTCNLSMDNTDRRFEPRNKSGVFQSIEERQNIDIEIGMDLGNGAAEYLRIARMYQAAGGWKTGDNDATMDWSLVDIIGLVCGRQYVPPAALPTTLSGWLGSVVAQLGENFANRYAVDPDYAAAAVTANQAADVTGLSCGDVIRYACMAAGVFPRTDGATGKLYAGPQGAPGAAVDLDNLNSYPVMRANEDIAAINFTLYDGNDAGTAFTVSGTATASGNTVDVKNPFIHTEQQALTAARLILSTYGGNKLETTGRGNPASEMGDVDTVQLDQSTATAALRIQQAFRFSGGVMRDCGSVMLQADGAFMFESMVVITESGQWTAPAEAGTTLRVDVVGGGDGGQPGQDGTWDAAGEDGAPGAGALIWSGTITINPQQTFDVTIGQGGALGQPGAATTFGAYSSANGQRFTPAFTDIASGDTFGRTGVAVPAPGSGDGGAGGAGGIQGNRHQVSYTFPGGGGTKWVVDNYPGEGEPGVPGASGCVVVYWSTNGEEG